MEQKGSEREILSPAMRFGDALVVLCMFPLFSFFYTHQQANTGFFTSRFGPLEMLCLYGPILTSSVAPLIRLAVGRKNPARPFAAAASLLLAIGSLWLIVVFPFEFAHFPDILPAAIRFLFGWLTNGLAIIPLYMQVIIGLLSAVAVMWKYFVVRMRDGADPRYKAA